MIDIILLIEFLFTIIVIFGSIAVFQAKFNPKQNNLITKAGNKIINFLEVNRRMLKKRFNIAANIFLIIGLIFVVGFYIYTLPQNSKAENFVDNYIQHSTDIALTYNTPKELAWAIKELPYNDEESNKIYRKYNKSQIIYTGFRTFLGRTKLISEKYLTETFYDEKTDKYFRLMYVERGLQRWVFSAILRDGLLINAKVNNQDLENPVYGAAENPIPIMMWTIPKWDGKEDYEKDKITAEQYRLNVYFYLAYIMSKKEFKARFGK